MRRLFLIAAALAACVCWMVAWPSRQAGLPRQRAAPRRARGLKGAAGLPRASLVRANRTTWRLPSGQCVQRAIVLPTMTCSLPHCNHTVDDDKLMVLTNQHVRKWVGYLRFNLGYLQMPAGARLVDAELRLFGTPQCRGGGRDGNNFTHQLHLLRPRQEATTIDINKPYPKRLCGQWAQQALWGRKFRVPINLNGRQLLTASRHKTLVFALSEKQFGGAALHAPKTLRRACGYLSSAHHEPDKWPRLALTYAWPCCDDGRVGTDGDDGADGTRRAPERESGGGGGRRGRAAAAAAEAIQAAGREGEAGGGGVSFQRPPWIKMMDWQKLRADQRVHGAWHTRLAASPPPWALHSRTDASAVACEPPSSRAHARGGQRRPPAGEAPALSVIVAYHNNENMTAACMEALFACADEAPRLAQTHHALDAPLLTVPGTAQVASAEYLFVDDGSEVRTGALPALLERLSRRFGIRYELSRYPVSVGFTLAVTEAARRANGTFLLFLNNDAFVRRDALRALLETFSSHADVGVVGAKLVGANRTMQEAGAIVWSGASGAWFLKSSRLREGRADEENHRLAYVRETDYVSAACAMVRRQTFVQQDMFDFHFSPGYYEDTDLAFTMRALGLRVLYQPFAHVFHESHTTYAGSMDALIERNRQHFISKWSAQLRHHMPPCEVAAACRQPHKTMYTHIAATRMYLFRVLWIDQVLPEPDRDSGSIRSLTMIKLLLAMRCHVSIVTVKRSGSGAHERYTKLLQWLGVHVIPSFRMMAAFTLREPYDFLFVARRDTFAEVRDTLYRQYPNTLLVFDTVDLHFLRERARLQFIQEHAGDTALLLAVFGSAEPSAVLANASLGNVQREVELDAASACAVAVVVSDEERRALRAELLADGREPPAIAVIANAHESAAPTAAPFEGRAGVVFVGNFNHLPNRDAVLFFANEVMPLILRQRRVQHDKGFVFHVVGANRIPPAILALNRSDGSGSVQRIVVHGHVPDLRPLYGRMRVSVAPLRWGAGVKGKVNSAHQLGVPVVCTSAAVAGMHATDGEHVLLGDTPAMLAAQVARVYYNGSLWRRLVTRGLELLDARFSASRAAIGTLEVLSHLRETNTLMGAKSLAIADARPRIYSDLRAAAALGGYYFNLTRLEPHLAPSDVLVPHNETCDAVVPTTRLATLASPRSHYFLQLVGRSGK